MFEKIFVSFWKTIIVTAILVIAFSSVFFMAFYTPDPDFAVRGF